MTTTDPDQRPETVHARIRSLTAAIDDAGARLQSWSAGRNPQGFDDYAEQRVRYLELSEQLNHARAQLEHLDTDAA